MEEGVCLLGPYKVGLQVHCNLIPRIGFQALRNFPEVDRGRYGGSHGIHPTKSQVGRVLAVALLLSKRHWAPGTIGEG